MRVHHNTDMKTLWRDKHVEVMKLEPSLSPYEGKHHHVFYWSGQVFFCSKLFTVVLKCKARGSVPANLTSPGRQQIELKTGLFLNPRLRTTAN